MDIRSFVDSRIESWFRNNLFTNIPARVVNVDKYESECVIDVQPVIADIRPEDNLVDKFPVILDVPVIVYSGGGAVVTIPIAIGDTVMLEVSMRDIQKWLEGSIDEIVIPDSSRTFDIADTIAKPCIYSKTVNPNCNPDDLELRYKDSIVRLKKDGNITISTKGNIVVEEAVDLEVTNSGNTTINTTGTTDINSTGDVTINSANTTITGELRVDGGVSVGSDVTTDAGISHNNHTHTGNLGSPTSPPLP